MRSKVAMAAIQSLQFSEEGDQEFSPAPEAFHTRAAFMGGHTLAIELTYKAPYARTSIDDNVF